MYFTLYRTSSRLHFIVVVLMFALCIHAAVHVCVWMCVYAKEYVDPLAILFICKELTVLSNVDMPKTLLK